MLLSIENLNVVYYSLLGPLKAVDNVSLAVGSGEWISIVGESGSGKSTLAFSIIRLVPPPGRIVSGSIYFRGVNLLALPDDKLREVRGKDIGMIFQDPMTSLDPIRRVGDQVVEVLIEHGMGEKKTAYYKAEALVKKAGLSPDILKRYPHQLSGGQRQRVMITISMIMNPKLLIADEPTTALDVIVQDAIMNLLEEMKEGGTSIVLITHDLALAAERSDKIAVMYAGEVVEWGTVDQLIDKPLHPYTKGLLESVPDVWTDRPVRPIPGNPPDLRNPPPGCRFHPRCPYATDVCKAKSPPKISVDGGRSVSCWLYAGEKGIFVKKPRGE